MFLRSLSFLAFGLSLVLAAPARAETIAVEDAYVRAATPASLSAAAFMVLRNLGEEDDRLIAATSEAAARVSLHSHSAGDDGVMRMREIEGGIALPAGGAHVMARGGDHVMLMGLVAPLAQGGEVVLTLTFERAGAVEVVVPVDHARKPGREGAAKH